MILEATKPLQSEIANLKTEINQLLLAGKTAQIFDFGQKKPSDFGEDLFFWRSPNFQWKIASIQFRNNENSGQVRLRNKLLKNPATCPFFTKV